MDMKKTCCGTQAKEPEAKAAPMADMTCGCGCGPWMMEKSRGGESRKDDTQTPPPPMP